MRRVQYSSHKDKSSRLSTSAGHTAGGISFAEFIDRLNEQPSVRTPDNKSFKDLVATIVSIVSFGMFKHIIG